MDGIIRIKIPQQLKEEFIRDRHFVEDNIIAGTVVANNIMEYINDDDIINVLREVNSVTEYSPRYGYVKNEGFFLHYKEWLNFALIQLMNAKEIDISDKLKISDMYSALGRCDEQLARIRRGEFVGPYKLIEQAEYFTHKQKDGANYNPSIKDMCSLFIFMGLRIINVENIANLSYEAYLESLSNEKMLTYI